MTRNTDNAVLIKDNAINNGKIKINAIEWYVPHYTYSMQQQSILSKQIKNKTPTQFQYPERSVFKKEVNTQNFWTFELGTQEGISIPTSIFVVFQQNDRQNDQNLNKDTFVRLTVISAQAVIGTERYPDSGVLLNYDDDDYSQGYGQRKEAFKALTKMIYSHHIKVKMILDRLMKVIILVTIYTFSLYDIRKILKTLNQSK